MDLGIDHRFRHSGFEYHGYGDVIDKAWLMGYETWVINLPRLCVCV